jgi:hypothetical protein
MKILALSIFLTCVLFPIVCIGQWKPMGPEDSFVSTTHPKIAAGSDGSLYTAFVDHYLKKITIRKYKDGKVENLESIIAKSQVNNFDLAVDVDDVPYLVYLDDQDTEIQLRKYVGGLWQKVGNIGKRGPVYGLQLKFSPIDKMAYVAFSGMGIEIYKFDGKAWTSLSGIPNENELTTLFRLALAPNGTPYVVYSERIGGNSYQLRVKKMIASSWESVGTPISDVGWGSFDIAVSETGIPYVVFGVATGSNSSFLGVSSFTNNSWKILKESLPSPHFSANNLRIGLSGDKVYVSYLSADNGKAMAFAYESSQWRQIGSLSAFKTYYPAMTIASDGFPAVVFSEEAGGWRDLVYKYNGESWNEPVPTSIFERHVRASNITLDGAGIAYLAGYSDQTGELNIKRFVKGSWENVCPTMKFGSSKDLKLVISSENILYISFSESYRIEGYPFYRLVVMKLIDGSLVPVGTTEELPGNVGNTDMNIDSKGIPYLIYQDLAASKTVVMSWVEGKWKTVGDTLSSLTITKCRIRLSGEDVPYLMYNTDNKMVVKKLIAGKWADVGGVLPVGSSGSFDLQLDEYNRPVILVGPGGYSLKVMRFENSEWVTLNPNFIIPSATSYFEECNKLALGPGGKILVFCQEQVSNGSQTLYEYTQGSWSKSIAIITPGAIYAKSFSITIDRNGNYLSAYDSPSGAFAKSIGAINTQPDDFALNSSNFELTTISSSCRGVQDGMVQVVAKEKGAYLIEVTGSTFYLKQGFTDTLMIDKLLAGSYAVRIWSKDHSSSQLVFTANVKEPELLKVSYMIDRNELTLSLTGAESFRVSVNGRLTETRNPHLSVQLNNGQNLIQVSGERLCQGTVSKEIYIGDKLYAYPNPFNEKITLSFSATGIVNFNLVNLAGTTVFSETRNNPVNPVFNFPLLSKGMYLLRIVEVNSTSVIKLIHQ